MKINNKKHRLNTLFHR